MYKPCMLSFCQVLHVISQVHNLITQSSPLLASALYLLLFHNIKLPWHCLPIGCVYYIYYATYIAKLY